MNKEKMEQIVIGKVTEQIETMRGWLVGQFFPAGSPFKDDNIEIYFKTFSPGNAGDKLHQHPQGREYVIVLSGTAEFRIGDEILVLRQGDYIAIPNNTPDKIARVIEEFSIIGVRYPSIPYNKVILEK